MKIHFICSGNTFRSRLAEAYLNSQNLSGISVSSSGIDAGKNFNGPIAYHTVWVADKFDLMQYMSESWRVTDRKEIEDQDIVIFMEQLHYTYCIEKLHCSLNKYEIWNIPDVKISPFEEKSENNLDDNILAEKIFNMIKEKVDELVSQLELKTP